MLHIEAFTRDDRRGSIEKAEPAAAERFDFFGERVARRGPLAITVTPSGGISVTSPADDLDVRVCAEPLGRKR